MMASRADSDIRHVTLAVARRRRPGSSEPRQPEGPSRGHCPSRPAVVLGDSGSGMQCQEGIFGPSGCRDSPRQCQRPHSSAEPLNHGGKVGARLDPPYISTYLHVSARAAAHASPGPGSRVLDRDSEAALPPIYPEVPDADSGVSEASAERSPYTVPHAQTGRLPAEPALRTWAAKSGTGRPGRGARTWGQHPAPPRQLLRPLASSAEARHTPARDHSGRGWEGLTVCSWHWRGWPGPRLRLRACGQRRRACGRRLGPGW
eukprot:3137608-Rhodomonas_salina.2